ncbi:hypothetical protein ES705_36019 [subsurface metagenome]
MDIISCHQRNIQLAAHRYETLVYLLQLRDGVSLYFQIEITKCLFIPQGSLLCFLEASFQNKTGHLTGNTCGKGNKALVILLEKLFIYPRLVVKAFKVRFGGELD